MKLGYLKLDVQSRPQRPRQLIPREHQSFFKVDGLVKCERWIRDNDNRMEESTAAWWLNRLIGRTKKIPMDWPYTLVEDKLFVLTLSAGQEGYGVSVDGRHVTSFPYRTAYVLKDATGLSVNWDIHAHNIFAGSLPTSHPSFAPQKNQKMSAEWQAPPFPDGPVELFISILSAGISLQSGWLLGNLGCAW